MRKDLRTKTIILCGYSCVVTTNQAKSCDANQQFKKKMIIYGIPIHDIQQH